LYIELQILFMKLIQFEPLFIRDYTAEVWPFPMHNHNHYEFIYINRGAGKHKLNGNISSYRSGDIFFLRPEDEHIIIIEEETHFSVLKFLPNALKGGVNQSNTDFWDNVLRTIAREIRANKDYAVGTHNKKIRGLVEVLIADWRENDEKVTELHTHLLRSILLLLEESFHKSVENNYVDLGNSTIGRMQNYIHTFIYYPEKLTVKQLASVFKMSESGIRNLFKREMEMPLREYIAALKIQQIVDRLQNSSSTISEIAQDYGFSDSSHFYRFFVKHTGESPKRFRKNK